MQILSIHAFTYELLRMTNTLRYNKVVDELVDHQRAGADVQSRDGCKEAGGRAGIDAHQRTCRQLELAEQVQQHPSVLSYGFDDCDELTQYAAFRWLIDRFVLNFFPFVEVNCI